MRFIALSSPQFHAINVKAPIHIRVENQKNFFYHVDGEPFEGKGDYTIEIQPKSLNVLI